MAIMFSLQNPILGHAGKSRNAIIRIQQDAVAERKARPLRLPARRRAAGVTFFGWAAAAEPLLSCGRRSPASVCPGGTRRE
jgi:hypothetical protein